MAVPDDDVTGITLPSGREDVEVAESGGGNDGGPPGLARTGVLGRTGLPNGRAKCGFGEDAGRLDTLLLDGEGEASRGDPMPPDKGCGLWMDDWPGVFTTGRTLIGSLMRSLRTCS